MKTSYAFTGLAVGLLSLAAVATVSHAGDPTAAAIGQPAPAFTLKDIAGADQSLEQYKGKIVVLEWFNPGCPFVKKHYENAGHKTMIDTYNKYKTQNVVWLAINSGAAGKEGASLEDNQKAKEEWGIEYPILLDPTGSTGHAYGATNTPHMFIVDAKGVLVYAGAIDDNRSPKEFGKNLVEAALDEVIAGKPVTNSSNRAYGCSVKYSK